MNKKVTIELSDAARLHAEKRVLEAGYESLDAYVDALIRDDTEMQLDQTWLRQQLEEGVASGNAGILTPAKLTRLITEGIARVKRQA